MGEPVGEEYGVERSEKDGDPERGYGYGGGWRRPPLALKEEEFMGNESLLDVTMGLWIVMAGLGPPCGGLVSASLLMIGLKEISRSKFWKTRSDE